MMYSIYPESLLNNLVYKCIGNQERDKKGVLQFLAIAKFLATNANLAMKEFQRGNIKGFDPLVRDRCCQVHAMYVLELFKDETFKEEVKQFEVAIKKILNIILLKTNKLPAVHFESQIIFKSFIKNHGLFVPCSKKMERLFHAHLLTFCSTIRDPYQIDYQSLKDKISKSLDLEMVKQIVNYVRTAFSEGSILFIQEEARKLVLEQGDSLPQALEIVRKFEIGGKEVDDQDPLLKLRLSTTCMFYNMKAVLQMASQKQTLILLKEVKKEELPKPIGVFFRSESPGGPFVRVLENDLNSDDPLLVFEGKVPQDSSKEEIASYIERETLQQIVLEEITLTKQFVVDDDLSALKEEHQLEVQEYQRKAKMEKTRGFYQIEHVYPSKVKYE